MNLSDIDWKSIGTRVGQAAPLLGTLLGGPGGAAVGALIASALGTSADPQAVAAELTANPEALVKLKQIESDRTVKLQELAVDQVKAEIEAAAADRASAREREIKTGDTSTPRILALLVTLGFFGVLLWLLAYGKPAEGGDALLVMLGSLGTAWMAIVSYYFGSSAGSADKTALLTRRA